MATLSTIEAPKKGATEQHILYCKDCNFICCKKYCWERHIMTAKHLKATNNTIFATKEGAGVQMGSELICKICNKQYKNRSGLWRHKKTCNVENQIIEHPANKLDDKINGIDKDELIIMLLKQNAELIKGQQDITMKVLENGSAVNNINNNNNTTTHTNSHNKAFNLNFFLNETCKNAMNITDFVDSIKLQLTDFIEVGEVGFVEGISNIIVKNLNELDETVRPIHCTDKKRETFYIRDQNKWEKEEEDMKQIRKMIKKVASKNEKLMYTYKEKYPEYSNPESKHSDKYSKFVIEALGGNGDNPISKENKIIRNIAKTTTIKENKKY